MKALVYRGPGKRVFEDRPRPEIKVSTDALVRVTNASVCGSDLSTMRGEGRRIAHGRILGSEGTGIVERIGAQVSGFCVGDRVLISCVTSCGACAPCRQGQPVDCQKGGTMLGSTIDGTCADYVRVPFADHSLISVGGAARRAKEESWTGSLFSGFEHDVVHGPDNHADRTSIVFGGSVGMEPLLSVMQYCRTIVRPALHSDRNRRPAVRQRAPRTHQHQPDNIPQRNFEPTNKR